MEKKLCKSKKTPDVLIPSDLYLFVLQWYNSLTVQVGGL